MTYITNKDYFHEVSAGRVAGKSAVIVGGFLPGIVSLNGLEDVWEGGDLITWLPNFERMRLESTSADDALGGIGMQIVVVIGLDDSYQRISELVALNGLTPVVTDKKFLRIERVIGVNSGDAEFNLGDITIHADHSGYLMGKMLAYSGITRSSGYTVPANKRARVVAAEFNISRIPGSPNPSVRFVAFTREGVSNSPWINRFEGRLDGDNLTEQQLKIRLGGFFDEKTDARVAVVSDVADVEIHTRYYIIEENV